MTAEQKARDMLDRIGVYNVDRFTSGDLAELANLIADTSNPFAAEKTVRLLPINCCHDCKHLRYRMNELYDSHVVCQLLKRPVIDACKILVQCPLNKEEA